MAKYMRIVRAKPAGGNADAVAERWAAFWPEKLRTLPGFDHAHFGIDRATGAVLGVQIYDERPDETVIEQLSADFRAALGAVNPPPPEITFHEIMAEA
jgi:hypothetical protein